MKKILLCILIFLFLGLIVNAQIKVVGNDYIDSLSASKNYFDRDIDFDAVFPAVSPQEKKVELKYCVDPYIKNINLSGDTIYLFSAYELDYYEFAINKMGKVTPTKTIPIGYYIISGYVFCIENENIARESAGLKAVYYGTSNGGPQTRTIKNLKKDILLGNKFDEDYIRYVTLTPIDTTNKDENTPVTYYCQNYFSHSVFGDGNNIQLRFYNEARKFIGKEMVFGIVEWDSLRLIKTIVDDFTGDPVKLADKSFIAKDIVMKGTSLYIVFQGEKTGSFVHKLKTIWYVYDKKDFLGGRNNEPDKCDIACLYFERRESYDDTLLICINDLRTLYERPKIAAAQWQKEMQLRNQQLEKRKIEQSESHKRKMIEKYGENIGILIGNHQVAIGMTFEMVRDAWGRPMNTYRTTTKYGQSEVWCYNYKTRVYFFDGKVVQIDD